MTVTTGSEIPNHKVTKIHGIVSGHSTTSELIFVSLTKKDAERNAEPWNSALLEAQRSLKSQASKIGANAVICVRQEFFVPSKGLIAVVLTGTAVTVE